ncbi:MAG: pyridoxamine 5'-phosphate oxidase [Flavobacteriales bacterium]|nr:pyridoxamine 5'-phosphate oxidase [Flavobacteriales bacterium]
MKEFLSKLRKDYGKMGLSEKDLNPDPYKQFEKWFTEAANAEVIEPNAFTLSTVSKEGIPSSRIVLLRNFDYKGFYFYTNYTSDKAQDIAENPFVCMNFFWTDVERQIRIQGRAEKISTLESMDYFKSRPRASQIGAWASDQSTPISSREELEQKIKEIETKFKGKDVEKPPFWGGFRIVPVSFEFWQGRPSRLHDRFRFTPKADKSWEITRLNP